jgi:hypothetical protein
MTLDVGLLGDWGVRPRVLGRCDPHCGYGLPHPGVGLRCAGDQPAHERWRDVRDGVR